MLAHRAPQTIEPIPLHAIAAKPFNWNLFTRMHGKDIA
jgi:6-phosphofructokinase 1